MSIAIGLTRWERNGLVAYSLEIELLRNHLVEVDFDDATVEPLLGLGPGHRVAVLRIREKLVELIPELLGLRLVAGAQAPPDPDPRLSCRLVLPRRVPKYNRVS